MELQLEEVVASLLQPAEFDLLQRIADCRRSLRAGARLGVDALPGLEAAILGFGPADGASDEPRNQLHTLLANFLGGRLRCLGSNGRAAGPLRNTTPRPTAAQKYLTSRERDVLEFLARAYTIKGIARELELSPGTVKWHVRNIYAKLGAFSRQDALIKAREPC